MQESRTSINKEGSQHATTKQGSSFSSKASTKEFHIKHAAGFRVCSIDACLTVSCAGSASHTGLAQEARAARDSHTGGCLTGAKWAGSVETASGFSNDSSWLMALPGFVKVAPVLLTGARLQNDFACAPNPPAGPAP